MNNEEKDILSLLDNISNEEIVRLMEGMDFEEVQIDDSARDRMKKNVMKSVKPSQMKKPNWMRRGLIAAGIAAAVTLSALSPTGQRALAEIARKLYFIPGAGKVVENEEQDIYILPKPVKYSEGTNEIIINSITKDIGLEIRAYGKGAVPEVKISIIDDKGNEYISSMGIRGQGYNWTAHYGFWDVPADMKSFSIIFSEGIKIPVTLIKAESYEDYASMGPSDVKNGLGLTLVPTKLDEGIKFDLIQHRVDSREISFYGKRSKEGHFLINVDIKDDKGNPIKAEYPKSYMGTMSEFSFKSTEGASKYIVEIPEITLKYRVDNEIAVPIPREDGEMVLDKTLEMHGFKLKFTRAVRNAGKVRLYVDTGYDSSKPENLSEVLLGGDFSYGLPLKDNLTTDYYEVWVKPGQKEFKLKFRDMYTIMKGPWRFEIKGE